MLAAGLLVPAFDRVNLPGQRIEHRPRQNIGEVSAPLGNARNNVVKRGSLPQPGALKIGEEEYLIFLNRATDRAAELVPFQGLAFRQEEIARVQLIVTQKFEHRPVIAVYYNFPEKSASAGENRTYNPLKIRNISSISFPKKLLLGRVCCSSCSLTVALLP